ncbi:hypothetical protein BST17_24870 [Mycolicibacterium bacteremicum]|uniref:Uncharacterized protein n=1 Tax=Mycolicibacterium bacteremicum TaxID=564198 RepID=A0A1W9YQ11_MYCBA|nr:hypothetical protein BST17_24870 [Mycolicibacterium bacteremicum]
MTANVGRTPNRFHHNGDVTVGGYFGPLHDITPIPFGTKHLHVRFMYGLSLDLTPADAAELVLHLTKGLRGLGITPNLAGATWEGE